MTQVIVNGNTYSDDGSAAKDMRNGGHRTYLLQMLSDFMVVLSNLITGTWVTTVVTKTGTGAQTVSAANNVILWNPTTPADVTFTLPASPAVGQRHRFKHRQITGQIFTMTVAPTSGTIDGAASVSMQVPNGEMKLLHLGSNDWTVEDDPGMPAGRNNILINAAMLLDQANEGAVVALTSGLLAAQYLADQWLGYYVSTATGVTGQWVSDAPSRFNHSIKLTVGTGAAVGNGHFLAFYQPIPTTQILVTGLGTALAQQIFLSFWVKSSIAPYTASASIRTPTASRSFPVNFKISSANTWERKVISIPGDTVAASWTSTPGMGAQLFIVAATGSTYQGAANTWASANYLGTSLNTNTILSTSGATFQIAGVKLEASPVPTDFETVETAIEFAQCMRFYEKSYESGDAPGTLTSGGAVLVRGSTMGASTGGSVDFKVPKRSATPTVTIYSPLTGASGKVLDAIAAADVTPTVVFHGRAGFTFTATMGGANVNLQANWVADARF